MSEGELETWKRIEREMKVDRATARMFETMFRKPGGRAHSEEELQEFITAFATMCTRIWAACRYLRCRRAELCRPPILAFHPNTARKRRGATCRPV